jgi:DNA-binding PadR family transcriptional regulator
MKKDIFENELGLNYNVGNKILKVLLSNNLVASDREGRWGARYRLTVKGREWLLTWLNLVEDINHGNF